MSETSAVAAFSTALQRGAVVGPSAQTWRWRVCGCVCGCCFAIVIAIEAAGFYRQGVTMQVLLLGGFASVAALAVGWATGKFRKFVALYASIGVGLILSEFAARAITRRCDLRDYRVGLFQFDEELGWKFVPGATKVSITDEFRTTVRVNKDGFRAPDFGRLSGRSTMVVLGDSFVSNLAVQEDGVFTQRMHSQLAPQWRVLNCGVDGYGQVQELLLQEQMSTQLQPSLVLLMVYVGNDFDDNLDCGDGKISDYTRPCCHLAPKEVAFRSAKGSFRGAKGDTSFPTLPGEAGWVADDAEVAIDRHVASPRPWYRPGEVYHWLRNTELHRLFREAFGRTPRPDGRAAGELRYCKRKFDPFEQSAMAAMKSLLARIQHDCRTSGCDFTVVIAPTKWQVHPEDRTRVRLSVDDYDFQKPQRLLGDFCRQLEVPCLDLLPSLTAFAEQGERLYFRDDSHWNGNGNRRVAELISEWVLERSSSGDETEQHANVRLSN